MNVLRRFVNGMLIDETITPPVWPVALLPLKLLAAEGDTGAGDIIERTIGPLGGNAFKSWFEITFGRKCGCSTRKENWNKRYPLPEKRKTES